MSARNTYLLLFFALLVLLPYFLLCYYIVPLADDYCFAWEALRQPSLFQAWKLQYQHWSGRYSANALVLLHPFNHGGLSTYQWAAVFINTIGIGVNFFLAKKVVASFSQALLAAMVVQLFLLFQLPVLSEGVYWYVGYCVYYLSNLCFGVFALLLYELIFASPYYRKIGAFVVSIPLLIALVGFNEPVLVLTCGLLLFLSVKLLQKNHPAQFFVSVLFAVSLLSASAAIFAPGNFVRASQAAHHIQTIKALLMAHVQMLRFVADWVSNLPFVLLSLFVILYTKKSTCTFYLGIRQLLLAIYLVLLVCIFFPYFFTGILGQHRTLNLAYWFFIPLCFLLLEAVARKYALVERLQFLKGTKTAFILVAVSLLIMAVTKNGYQLAYDFSKGNLKSYKTELLQREQLVQRHWNDTLFHLPPIKNRPASIFLYDENDPSMKWQEKCVMEYYKTLQLYR